VSDPLVPGALSDDGPFKITFDREPNQGAYHFDIRGVDDRPYAEVYDGDFANGLRQALHYADPNLAAEVFPGCYAGLGFLQFMKDMQL
jgi:hypothetical protein